MIKALKKLGIERMFFNIIKTIYYKPVDNIILNGEQLKPFLVKSENTQGDTLFPILFSIVLEYLASRLRVRNKRDSNREGKSLTIPICR
jgi:hypothetical protein